jgi:hypothetical protein
MRPKEWLVSKGHLPAGSENARGRISRDNIALIEAAVAGGAHIEGYSVSKPTSSVEKPVITKVKPGGDAPIGETPQETVPEQYNIAMVGTTDVGNRAVCDTCHRSLNFHICDRPRVMYNGVSSVVVFKSRPNPEAYRPNKWW